MKNSSTFVVLLSIVISLPISADTIGSINTEKAKLQKRIQCARQSNIPAGEGLGSMWGCYNINEQVKLWINGKVDKPSEIKNIKLAVVKYHGSTMDITGKIWTNIISEEYGATHTAGIRSIFQDCPVKQSFKTNNSEILIQCSKGQKADEHTLVIYPQ